MLCALLIISILTGCSDKNIDNSELLRTGEFFTAEQMETLKTQALNWQSSTAGIGRFADIVAIEPADGSEQQVFISVFQNELFEFFKYERIQIQPPNGAKARIISASSGGGSGELQIGYRLFTEDTEWIEIFYIYAGDLMDDNEYWETDGKWVNVTEFQSNLVESLNEMPLEERQFR